MIIGTLIDKVQTEKPNTFSDEQILAFINEIEIEVAEQLGLEHEEYTTKNTKWKKIELIASPPYDRLYVSYVKAMIDYANEEYDSYANNQAQHVQDFRDYVDWVVRTDQKKRNPFPKRFKNVM